MISFGKKIRELREEKNLTQPQLAKELGVSNAVISYWENDLNEPKASHIEKIAIFFNVSTDYLIKSTDDFAAVAPLSTVPVLSAEEKVLLQNFRSMRKDLQAYFLEMSETFIQTPNDLIQQEKNKRKNV